MRTSHVREHWIHFLFACYLLGFCLSLAQTPEQTILRVKGILGGSVTFPAPVFKTGSLTYKDLGAAAMVFKGSSDTQFIEQFKGRLQWDSQTGHFTITHLRTEDSGTYVVDCKDEQSKPTTFQLEVYKNVSTPTVTWVQSERKNCSVLCFVENGREVTLSWLRDGEMLSRTSNPDTNTSLSLLLALEKEGRTYYCETKNPVSSQLYRLDVPSNCTEESDEKLPVPPRNYIPIVVTVCLLLCILVVVLFFLKRRKKHFAQDTDTPRQRASVLHYAELSHGNQSNQAETQNIKLTTVYDELQLCRVSAAAEQC